MTTNIYAPPNADLTKPGIQGPALWNPDAAANWCLMFSVCFGAYLHMKNWQALGELGKARAAKVWFGLGIMLLISILILPFYIMDTPLSDDSRDGVLLWPHLGLIVLLLFWYFGSARAQARYVEARFGENYQRKGWVNPLFVGVLLFVCIYFVVMICVIAILARGV